jgi:hypothetical protein
MLRENTEAFVQAFSVDLRKPRLEVLGGEIGPIVTRAALSAAQLDEWTSDENLTAQVPDYQQTWSPTVLKRPKGVVLIISYVSDDLPPSVVTVVSVPLLSLPPSLTRFVYDMTGPGITPSFSACSHSSAP